MTDQHIVAAGQSEVEAGKRRMLGAVRAHKLAEVRRQRGLTQRQVALAMGVTVGRVSQIESVSWPGLTSLTGTWPPSVGICN